MASVLAIDLGTGGPKVALVALDGALIARERETVALRMLPGGGAEQDPRAWWDAVTTAARRLPRRDDVIAVATTGQWAGTVALDAAGEPLTDALIWMDARGAPYAKKLAAPTPVAVGGYDPRRIARWIRRTGGAPSLSGRDTLGHLLYLKAERPEVYAQATTFLEPFDYLTFRLTGRRTTSKAAATVTWCADTRDLYSLRYDAELVALAGLDEAKLPEILPTNAVVGPLTETAAQELNLRADTPVIAGTPDNMAAAAGSGAVADHAAHLYIGTSSWLSCHVPYKRTDPLRSVAALPSALPDRYIVVSEQQTAGVSFERLRDVLLPGSGDQGLAELEALAATAPPGSGGAIFTPWLNGERTPVDDHRIRGGLHQLSLQTTRADIARSVLEGVALNTRWMQQAVERFCKRRLEPITFIGGGARSSLWAQIMADVLRRPVRRGADPVDAGVRGAAYLAGLALGRLTREEIASRAPIRDTYDPDPAAGRIYDERFDLFVATYKATRKLPRKAGST